MKNKIKNILQHIRDFLSFITFILTRDISLLLYRKYFISFVEEFWFKTKHDAVTGRVEVCNSITGRTLKEIPICTDNLNRYYKVQNEYDFKDITKRELQQLEGEIAFLNSKNYSIGYDYRYKKGLSIQIDNRLHSLRCPYCNKECLKWNNWIDAKYEDKPLLMCCKNCNVILDIDTVRIGRRIK